jgi:hypothetical protein
MMSGAQMEKTYNESFLSDGTAANLSAMSRITKQEKIDQVKFLAPQRPLKRPNVPSRTILSKLKKFDLILKTFFFMPKIN